MIGSKMMIGIRQKLRQPGWRILKSSWWSAKGPNSFLNDYLWFIIEQLKIYLHSKRNNPRFTSPPEGLYSSCPRFASIKYRSVKLKLWNACERIKQNFVSVFKNWTFDAVVWWTGQKLLRHQGYENGRQRITALLDLATIHRHKC